MNRLGRSGKNGVTYVEEEELREGLRGRGVIQPEEETRRYSRLEDGSIGTPKVTPIEPEGREFLPSKSSRHGPRESGDSTRPQKSGKGEVQYHRPHDNYVVFDEVPVLGELVDREDQQVFHVVDVPLPSRSTRPQSGGPHGATGAYRGGPWTMSNDRSIFSQSYQSNLRISLLTT